jgi:hypothetical protein
MQYVKISTFQNSTGTSTLFPIPLFFVCLFVFLAVPGSLDKEGGRMAPSFIKKKVVSSSALFV